MDKIAKKGKERIPSPSSVMKNRNKANRRYLVFPSSFFSIGLSGAFSGIAAPVSAGFWSPPAGAADSAGAGAAGAGGGGGGAGSSFLPQPAKVRVKAKSVTLDNKTIFFPIFSSPPFPSHISQKQLLLSSFYCTSRQYFQGELRGRSGNLRIVKSIAGQPKNDFDDFDTQLHSPIWKTSCRQALKATG
jgi:hypothetical protein